VRRADASRPWCRPDAEPSPAVRSETAGLDDRPRTQAGTPGAGPDPRSGVPPACAVQTAPSPDGAL
jgi:hypothetical protein